MTQPVRQPLQPSSIIEYMDMRAYVISDDGADGLIVNYDGAEERWDWSLEGHTCKVVWTPGQAREALPAGTEIEYMGVVGIVVSDEGGDSLVVLSDGVESKWQWAFEGHICAVFFRP